MENIKDIVLNNKLARNRLLVVIEKNLKCPICGQEGLIDGEGYICTNCNQMVLSEEEVNENIEEYAKEEDYIEAYEDIKFFIKNMIR